MSERIVGNPDRLEMYTQETRETIGLERGSLRSSIQDYMLGLWAFLQGHSFRQEHPWQVGPSIPANNFGDGGVMDRSIQMNQIVDRLADLDAKPAAFAFALRELDQRPLWPEDTSGRPWTVDIGTFEALVKARLDPRWQGSSDANFRSYMHRETGSAAAKQMAKDGGHVDPALLEQLRKSVNEPDFVRGFFDTLGPQGLAELSARVLYSNYYESDPAERRPVYDVLSQAFGTYSRTAKAPVRTTSTDLTPLLDDRWLDQFGAPSGVGERPYRLDLLAPLLVSGEFDRDFLNAVATRMLYPHPTDDNTNGWGEYDPWTLVYAAIAKDPLASSDFLKAHQLRLREMSTGSTGPVPDYLGMRNKAFADLVRSATVDLRGDDEALARQNTKFVIDDLYLNKENGHVSPEMQATYGLIIEAYFNDFADSVTTLVPEAIDPGMGKGIGVSEDKWIAFLDETLGNGPSAVRVSAAVAEWDRWRHRERDRLIGDNSQLTSFQDAVVENLFIERTYQTMNRLEGDIAQWRRGVRTFRDPVVALAVGDGKGAIEQFLRLVTDPIIDRMGPEDIVATLEGLRKVEPLDWRRRYATEAPNQWINMETRSKINPVPVHDNLPGSVPAEDGSGGFVFTGDPSNYGGGDFWSKVQQEPFGSMTPEEWEHYKEWLEDPAISGATYQAIAPQMQWGLRPK